MKKKSGYNIGVEKQVVSLCREIRMGVLPGTPAGTRLSGYNTIDDRYEEWVVTRSGGKTINSVWAKLEVIGVKNT